MEKVKRSWKVIWFLVVLHILVLTGYLSWYFFTWTGLSVGLALSLVTGFGVTVGYHRYLTHTGFVTTPFLRKLLSICGLLAGQGPPLKWVADHRKHHQFSDQDGDPHSPKHGWFHAHMGWLTIWVSKTEDGQNFKRYTKKDLYNEPFMRFLNRSYLYWHLGLVVTLLLSGGVVGFLLNGWAGAWRMSGSFFVFGFLDRMVWVWHNTWAVNSITHIWGYRNYKTRDNSTNNPLVGVGALGEGWHNNHHAFPSLTWHGHRWFEVDVSGRLIWLLKKLGLVWGVKDTIPKLPSKNDKQEYAMQE